MAPYTVTCLSTTAELLKISAVEFTKKVLKDPQSETQLLVNLKKKQFISVKKETSNHEKTFENT